MLVLVEWFRQAEIGANGTKMKWNDFLEHPQVVEVINEDRSDPGKVLFEKVTHDILHQMTDLVAVLELAEKENLSNATIGRLQDRRPHFEAWIRTVTEMVIAYHEAPPPGSSWPELITAVGKVPAREEITQMVQAAQEMRTPAPTRKIESQMSSFAQDKLEGLDFLIESILAEEYLVLWELNSGHIA